MVSVLGKNVYINANTFTNNVNIVNVDLCNLPFISNSMANAFSNCSNLINVTNINQNITDMSYTFSNCQSIVKSPTIPNSVTSISGVYSNCYSLTNIPVIPNSVTNIQSAFYHCNSLTNVPDINLPNCTNYANCFAECNSINDINVVAPSGANLYGMFTNCNYLHKVNIVAPNTTNMMNIFNGCYELFYVNIEAQNYNNIDNLLDGCYLIKEFNITSGGHPGCISSMMQDKYYLEKIYLNVANETDLSSAFCTLDSLQSVECLPPSVINMCEAFKYCSYLNSVVNIPNSVVDMSWTFSSCYNLVNAPVIPNSVTNMQGTFSDCPSLVNIPVIPNSVTDMNETFSECTSLVNAPVIPNSVTNMCRTFAGCEYLRGNIYIFSNQIEDISQCFIHTNYDVSKNVYIPYTYENGIYTTTYNTFTDYGYDEEGSKHGIYLKDIDNMPVTVTVNQTPVDATVRMADLTSGANVTLDDWTYTNTGRDYTLQTYTGSDTSVNVPSVYTVTNSIESSRKHEVGYIVSKDGYYTESGSERVLIDETINVELQQQEQPIIDTNKKFTVVPVQTDATVILTAEGYTQEGNSIIVPEGTEVSWSVSRPHCTTQSGTVTINNNYEKIVSLEIEVYTFTINPTPADADVEILVNGKLVNGSNDDWVISANNVNNDIELQNYIGSSPDVVMPTTYNITNSTQVIYSDIIEYKVKRRGYNPVSDTLSIDETTTLNIELEYNPYHYDVSDYNYTLSNNTLTLESYTGNGGNVVVPDGNSS